jgi:hypothetical protein
MRTSCLEATRLPKPSPIKQELTSYPSPSSHQTELNGVIIHRRCPSSWLPSVSEPQHKLLTSIPPSHPIPSPTVLATPLQHPRYRIRRCWQFQTASADLTARSERLPDRDMGRRKMDRSVHLYMHDLSTGGRCVRDVLWCREGRGGSEGEEWRVWWEMARRSGCEGGRMAMSVHVLPP